MQHLFLNINPLFYLIPVIMGLAGLIIGRWNGGGRPKFLKWLDNPLSQILYAYPYLIILWLTAPAIMPLAPAWFVYWHIFLVFALTVVTILKGHGRNMDLGTSDKNKPNAELEWYEGLIYPLYGKIPNYWYDALGLVISGLTYTLPSGLYTANPFLALSGAFKAPSYMLGKFLCDRWPNVFIRPKIAMDGFTAYGEAFTCAALHSCAGVVIVYLLAFLGFIS